MKRQRRARNKQTKQMHDKRKTRRKICAQNEFHGFDLLYGQERRALSQREWMLKSILQFFSACYAQCSATFLCLLSFFSVFSEKFPLKIRFYLPFLFEYVTFLDAVVVAVAVVVLLRYCSPMRFLTSFIFFCFAVAAVSFQVFSGRKQKQSYVHNNLRFSLCMRCYLHVQTTAFSGENMHENRKESLLCIVVSLSPFRNRPPPCTVDVYLGDVKSVASVCA